MIYVPERNHVGRDYDKDAGWQIKIEWNGSQKWLSVTEATILRDKLTAMINRIKKDPRK